MTGYLQRLAAGAAKIDRPIHPVLQPMFSTAGSDAGSDPPSVEEFSASRAAGVPPQPIARPTEPQRQSTVAEATPTIATVAEAAPPVATAAVAPKSGGPSSPPPLVHAHVVAAAPAGRDVSPPRSDHQRRDNPDKLEQRGEEPDGAEAPAIRVHGPPPPDHAAPQANVNEGRDDGARRDAGRVRSERTFVPLLAPAVGTQDPTPAAAARPPPQPASIRAGPARRVQDTHRTASEPNEVQIHIGRIEVTAVPPAPARPSAATPRRNAMSLDDYLKRRNGRAP